MYREIAEVISVVKGVSSPFILKGIDKSKSSLIIENIKGQQVVTKVHAFVNPKLLKMSEFQPRVKYDLEGIKRSIEKEGIKEEIQVNEHENGDLTIVDGARRTLASIELEKEEVPIIIKKMSKKEEQESVLIANIIKKSFTPIELARSLRSYKEKWEITNVELGKKFFPQYSQVDTSSEGKAPITSASQNVGRYLKILELPIEVQNLIENGYSVEKAYRLTYLKIDRNGEEPPEWEEKRRKLQTDLAKANIPLKDLRGRISVLIKQEKEVREKVRKERKVQDDLKKEYDRELKNAISEFIKFINIDIPIPNSFTDFNINDLKKEKELWDRKINKNRINEKDMEYIQNAIDLIMDLVRLIPYVEELKEIKNDVLNKIVNELSVKFKNQKKINEEIDKKIFISNGRWSDIQIVMRKIEQFLYMKSRTTSGRLEKFKEV